MAKIRTGFVSNSSSSSFILAFPKGTELTFATVAKEMFPDNPDLKGGFNPGYGYGISLPDAVQSVLTNVKPATDEDLNYECGGFEHADVPAEMFKDLMDEKPDWNFMVYGESAGRHDPTKYESYLALPQNEKDARYLAYNDLHAAWTARVKARLLEMFGESDFYVVEYEDHDSFGSTMEHGGVFDNMIDRRRAVRISHH